MKLSKNELLIEINSQGREELFEDLYSLSEIDQSCLLRIQKLLDKSEGESINLFSAPGRTELGGNHTDHNNGKVLSAAVQHDTLAAVSVRSDDQVIIHSDGFEDHFQVDIGDLAPRSKEFGTTNALIRGVLAGFNELGAEIGGFTANLTSRVGIGSGLSSSASFEVLVGTILNYLFNDNKVNAKKIAQIGQYAENKFFNKPCGLMDQTTSAVGGILSIDFKDPEEIEIEKLEFKLTSTDYLLVVINTGHNHADLIEEYAAIPSDMKSVAKLMGSEVLRNQKVEDFLNQISSIRSELGDRPIQRALHYYSENQRVDKMVKALSANDFDLYLEQVKESGASSQNLLQNIIPTYDDEKSQGLSLALGLSHYFFNDRGRGVARVHGGGFAGTIQAYVHNDDFQDYRNLIENLYGTGSLEIIKIRNNGAGLILNLINTL